MDCSPPDSSVHEILQARILEWVAISFSRGFSWPRDGTVSLVPHALAGEFFTTNATWEAQGFPVSVQFSHSVVSNSVTPWTTARHAFLSITNTQSPPKPMSIESVMPSNHLILCRPLLLLPWIFPNIRVFSNESALHIRWPKYWSFIFSISPSNEHSGLISSRMDWLDLLAVQGILNSLLQHHSSKASILRCSAFFIVQLSHPYMTTGKTIFLTRWTFVGKLMSLLFIMLSRYAITFLPRSKCFSNFMDAVTICSDFGARIIKSATVSTVSPSICHEVMGPDAMILVPSLWGHKRFQHDLVIK